MARVGKSTIRKADLLRTQNNIIELVKLQSTGLQLLTRLLRALAAQQGLRLGWCPKCDTERLVPTGETQCPECTTDLTIIGDDQ